MQKDRHEINEDIIRYRKNGAGYKLIAKLTDTNTVNLRALIKRDKNTCAICGRQCDLYDYTVTETGAIVCGDRYPSVDHIYPLIRGGTNTWNNVQLACLKCNIDKRDKIDG